MVFDDKISLQAKPADTTAEFHKEEEAVQVLTPEIGGEIEPGVNTAKFPKKKIPPDTITDPTKVSPNTHLQGLPQPR